MIIMKERAEGNRYIKEKFLCFVEVVSLFCKSNFFFLRLIKSFFMLVYRCFRHFVS